VKIPQLAQYSVPVRYLIELRAGSRNNQANIDQTNCAVANTEAALKHNVFRNATKNAPSTVEGRPKPSAPLVSARGSD